jgi:hypothetical protein
MLQTTVIGLITIAILGFVGNLHQSTYEKTSSVILESNLVTVSSMVESDFNKIGYDAPSPSIVRADSVFSFLADLHNNGTVQTVTYAKALVPATSDTGLQRTVSGESSIISNVGLSKLNFAYFDSLGNPTTVPSAVKSVNVMISLVNRGKTSVQDTSVTKHWIPSLFWTKTFYIQN